MKLTFGILFTLFAYCSCSGFSLPSINLNHLHHGGLPTIKISKNTHHVHGIGHELGHHISEAGLNLGQNLGHLIDTLPQVKGLAITPDIAKLLFPFTIKIATKGKLHMPIVKVSHHGMEFLDSIGALHVKHAAPVPAQSYAAPSYQPSYGGGAQYAAPSYESYGAPSYESYAAPSYESYAGGMEYGGDSGYAMASSYGDEYGGEY